MSKGMEGFRLVRIVSSGTGSKRVTIPKDMLDDVLGNSDYAAISKENGEIVIKPIEVKAKR